MRRTPWLSCAAVALLAAGLHVRTLGFAFVFDDLHLVVHNAFLREPWSPLTCFTHHFWHGTPFGAAYYRPMVVLSLALNGRLLGWGPAGFHLFNVLLHAVNSALLVTLARRIGCTDRAATAAGLLFAVHPVAAWPVGSIVARVDLLPAFFLLLAWIHWQAAGERIAGRNMFAVGAGCFFLLALLAKESAAAFLVVPLLGPRTMRDDEGAWKPSRPAVGALCVGLGAYLAARRSAGLGLLMDRSLVDPLANPLAVLPFPSRLWGAIRLSGRYLVYLFAPLPFRDPADYLGGAALPSLTTGLLASVLLLLVWGSAVVILWWRRDRIAVPLAFSLASFLPASNLLFPIGSLYAQNFLYMPLLGLCLACGELLGRMRISSPRLRLAAAASTGLVLAILAMTSYREAGIWRNGVSLFTALTERFPHYPNAHSALGVALLDSGKPKQAIAPLRTALALTDRSVEAHYNLGVALLLTRRGRPDLEEAYEHFRRATELKSSMVEARLQTGRVLLLLERPSEAVVQFRELASLYPNDLDIRSRLVDSLIRSGNIQEARTETLAARRVFPDSAWFDFCLARIKARTGGRVESLALLETAIAKDPEALTWIGQVHDFDAYRGTVDFDRVVRSPDPNRR